jgi:hypothetical protein
VTLSNAPPAGGDPLKKISKKIDQAFETVARLSGSGAPPSDFYQEFLKHTVEGIDGIAGAVWIRTPQGFLQLQCQVGLDRVGLDDKRGGRQTHNELLRRAFQMNRPMMLEPYGRLGTEEGPLAANMSEFLVILAPLLVEEGNPIGLVEVWHEPAADPRMHPTYVNYVVQMSGYASNYQRNLFARKSTGQEGAWIQLESFARVVHSSLNPTEVAFQVANEGRRIIGCDRIAVGVRYGQKVVIEAVSGADVVEKASTQIKRMRALLNEVITWGEKLVFHGTRDEALPPRVLHALDDYLAETNPKHLIITPVRDDREKPTKDRPNPDKARSAILMECYESPEKVEVLEERLDVVANHAASALYNAAEMKRVPFRFLWRPIATLQEGLGGKARFWMTLGLTGLVILILAMIFVPYPLKLDAKGQLVPEERNYIYPQRHGTIASFSVKPGDVIRSETPIATLRDPDLAKEYNELQSQLDGSNVRIRTLSNQAQKTDQTRSPAEYAKLVADLRSEEAKRGAFLKQIESYRKIFRLTDGKAGMFQVVAPKFAASRSSNDDPQWTVLTADFPEQLTNKWIETTNPMMRVGNKNGAWQIEQKIPQKHVGQLLKAFKTNDPEEYLDVDVLVRSAPEDSFRGRLYRRDIAGEAVPNKDDHDQSEPVVHAYVTINHKDIPVETHIPRNLLVTGVEVSTKIRCGNHSMGYSLFYGVWEFLYENVIFFF